MPSCLSLILALWLAVLTSLSPGYVLASGDPEAAARQRAIVWLHTQQLSDGGFGETPAKANARSSASATADAVYTLALIGEKPAGKDWTVNGHSALDALAALAPAYARTDAGQAGKVARAVTRAGGNTNARSFAGLDLIAIIENAYDPVTGRYSPDLQYRHTLALESLALAGRPIPAAAFDTLLLSRRSDGGWFWAFDGEKSDVDSTGRVLQVLATYAPMRCAPVLTPVIDYLVAQQAVDGWAVGNLPGPPNADSTALAVAGLRAAGYDVSSLHPAAGGASAMDALLAFQEPSGAFAYTRESGKEESRLVATLDALNALAPQAHEAEAFCRAVYLPLRLVPGA